MVDDGGSSQSARRHGYRLLRAGAVLLLLGLLVGLAVPRLTLPRLALSTHLLGITQGTLLIAAGLLWPRLKLAEWQSGFGSLLAVYGCSAAWTANFLGAVWGAGASMVPMAAGGARGSAVQEGAVRVLLVSGAVSLLVFVVTLLWGLRGGARTRPEP